MKLPLTTDHGPRTTDHAPRGFTLIEILVTIALLSFIILGLYGMFTQVQRAFRMSMRQVDLLEAGRAVTEMIPRELDQITPAGYPYPDGVNFCAQLVNGIVLTQPLPGSAVKRTNLLQDCFLLLRDNQTWFGIGYCVRTNDAAGYLWLPESGPGQMSVGSLYRFSASTNVLRSDGVPSDPTQLYRAFQAACRAGTKESLNISNRICDGVIHFHFRTFATNGFPVFSDGATRTAFYRTDQGLTQFPTNGVVPQAWTEPDLRPPPYYPDRLTGCYFLGNAVPASIELELGILDQRTWERYNSIPTPAARLAYLQRTNISSQIQLFRQRIPVRNVDPLAYQ